MSIYSIEGNIGSGKSTLVKMMKEQTSNVVFVQEPVDVWNTIKDNNNETILEKYYKNQEKYAFSFQIMAYISRISILRKTIKKNPNAIIITERSVLTDKNVFAKMLYDDKKIEEINYKIYLQWFDEFIEELPIAGIIYVKATVDVCFSRINKRNRKGELIPIEYLKNCNKYHNDWLHNDWLDNEKNIMVLNADEDKEYTVENYNEWIIAIKKFIDIPIVSRMSKIE
tara:strand:- start:1551 stop:2228 length:678 start_codon:yes stop_codon:yes gene_type:complete